MQPESEKPSLKVIFRLGKKEKDAADSSSAGRLSSPPKEVTNVPAAPSKASPLPEHDDTHRTDTGDDQSADLSKQIVLYDPAINGSGDIEPVNGLGEIDHVTKPDRLPSFSRFASPNGHPRVLPSVGTYTVQCANCFKWRLIPSKEKYEEIRENILENPFYCETAREWRPDVSCEDPEDISQDGSRLWAIDKPNIARPPPGWQRILRIRGEGGTKFADVYYVSPTGKRLRSMVEVQKYLMDHPEYINSEVTLSKFSFQIPKPLQENYVRKRPPRVPASQDVPPLSWAEADYNTDLQLETPALPAPPSYSEASDFDSVGRPAKKQARSNDP